MKTMNIAKLVGFPFPTPPDVGSVKAAIQVPFLLLVLLICCYKVLNVDSIDTHIP